MWFSMETWFRKKPRICSHISVTSWGAKPPMLLLNHPRTGWEGQKPVLPAGGRAYTRCICARGVLLSYSGSSKRRKVPGRCSGETNAGMVEEIPCQVIFSSRQKKPVSFWPWAKDSLHCGHVVKSYVGLDVLCYPMNSRTVRGKNANE